MASSNFASFWPVLIAAHQAAVDSDGNAYLKLVEDVPLNPADWLNNFMATDANVPAAHLSIPDGDQPITGDTSGGHSEKLKIRTTVLWQNAAVTPTLVIALRDSIIDAIESDVSLGGYADLITCTSWGRDKQEAFSSVFHLEWEISNQWAV